VSLEDLVLQYHFYRDLQAKLAPGYTLDKPFLTTCTLPASGSDSESLSCGGFSKTLVDLRRSPDWLQARTCRLAP